MLTPTYISFQDLESVRMFDISTEIYEKHMFIDEKVINLGSAFTHNPEVVGSSPASATIKTPDFITKSGVFLTF